MFHASQSSLPVCIEGLKSIISTGAILIVVHLSILWLRFRQDKMPSCGLGLYVVHKPPVQNSNVQLDPTLESFLPLRKEVEEWY